MHAVKKDVETHAAVHGIECQWMSMEVNGCQIIFFINGSRTLNEYEHEHEHENENENENAKNLEKNLKKKEAASEKKGMMTMMTMMIW